MNILEENRKNKLLLRKIMQMTDENIGLDESEETVETTEELETTQEAE